MRTFCLALCIRSLAAFHCDAHSFLQAVTPNRSRTGPNLSAADGSGPSSAQKSLVQQAPNTTQPKQKGDRKNGTNSSTKEDEELFPPDDPKAPRPWQDVCVVAGSGAFTTLLVCLTWLGLTWSEASLSRRIGWNFSKLILWMIPQVLMWPVFSRTRYFAMVQVALCLVATTLALLQAQLFGIKEDDAPLRWLCPWRLEGGLIFITLQCATLLALAVGTLVGAQVAFGFSLVAVILAVILLPVVNEDSEVPHLTWATLSSCVLLPLIMSKVVSTFLHIPLAACTESADVLSLRYSRAAAYSLFFFMWILWICYRINPGAFWRPAVLGVVLIVLTPGLSHITGVDVFYGPWAMFGGSHDGWELSLGGKVVISMAAVLVVMARRGSPEILTFDFGRRGQEASLSLVRILIPFWIFEHVNWGGDDSPISKWFSPQLMPGGDTALGHILMRLNLLLLAAGLCSPFFAMVTTAGFVVACSRNSFDPDCPTQHVSLLLLILAFTPCDARYSLSNVLREHVPSAKRFLLDGGDHLWAKNLFRLHCSLLYFFAAEFKIQPEWLGPHGGSLIKDIHIFELSPLRDLESFLLPSQRFREILAHIMAISIILLEISLAFGFWSARYHGIFLCAAASMHLMMSLLCGQLGGFTQIGWVGLLSMGHPKLEEILQEPKNFALVTLGCICLFCIMGDIFELYEPPA